ncbi:DUF4145 domain-containing protein [Ruegeria aquimaris]|uniref:DUF4145 domain-containing protein n=1 Tax=Ruegeria aquimaris TaxID=2984333 RepID=A0ABT3AEU5_9RHOB|nr:DUF4145 domain-containing protein [Ruegeria sp. XHP0148]MCV2887204.1 DUF4145 domain-containing protein [Ruegeria sp. XHP0148]
MSEEYFGAFGQQNQRKAPCPECGKVTRVDTLFERIDRWHEEGPDISGLIENYVFQCRGCETLFFAKSTGNSEDYIDYYDHVAGEHVQEFIDQKSFWPALPQTPVPSWAGFNLFGADQTLHELLHSVYTAMNSNLPVLAAIGMRTAFDRTAELLGVNADLSFGEKLEELRKGGHISGVQKGVLEVLIDAGSAAAHRGWKPKDSHLATMKEILEALIRDHFVLKREVEELKRSIPSRSKPA